MEILFIGTKNQIDEVKSSFNGLSVQFVNDLNPNLDLSSFTYILDVSFKGKKKDWKQYQSLVPHQVLIINSVFQSLSQGLRHYRTFPNQNIVGFNGLPTMLQRNLWEMTTNSLVAKERVDSLVGSIGKKVQWIEDRVGMITPRVVAMIINEAYYTVQEGTANKNDIDLAMKLGTRYPLGPFEWCNLIGLENVYGILKSIYKDTKDPRYLICPLLKNEYLQTQGN